MENGNHQRMKLPSILLNQEKLGTVPAMSQAEVDEAMKAARAQLSQHGVI